MPPASQPLDYEGELPKLLNLPLTQYRISLHQKTLERPENNPNKTLTNQDILEEIQTLKQAHPHPKIQRGLQSAYDWLLNQKEPTASELTTPETQAGLGLALFLNEKRAKDQQSPTQALLKNPRLQQEKTQCALMLASFLGNHSTRLKFGPPGSWFYFDPKAQEINIDLAQALILGLQNSRAILLHEIGHSELTLGRTPKMEAIQQKIRELSEETQGKPLSQKTLKEILGLDLELSAREAAFQYLEDATVNTFAEITGAESNQKIIPSIHRNYTTIGISRQNKTQEKEKKLQRLGLGSPTKEYQEKMTALGFAHPLLHNLAGENPENWEALGTKKTPKILQLLKQTEEAAQLQPHIQNSREDRLMVERYTHSKKTLFQKRAEQFDDLFDKYLQEDIKKQKEEIAQDSRPLHILLEDPHGKTISQTPNNSNSPNETHTVWRITTTQTPPPQKQQGKEWDGGTTLKELLQGAEAQIREQAESQKSARTEVQKKLRNAIKASQSTKTILDEIPPLPAGKETYEGVLETYRPHILTLGRLLHLACLSRKENRLPTEEIFPDDKTGTHGLQLESLLQRILKKESGQVLAERDFQHWNHQLPKTSPAITRFLLHLDLTGSTQGEVAKMVALTTVILKEAAKPFPHLQIIATASQGGKPQAIVSPTIPEKTQKEILGHILKTGCGKGDNEIDAPGLIFSLQEAEKIPVAPKQKIGKTHILMITDGGVSDQVTSKLIPTLQTLLQNPLLEFDILIPDASCDNNLLQTLQNPQNRTKLRRKPEILLYKSAPELLKKIALHFKKQAQHHPPLAVENPTQNRQRMRQLSKKIKKIGIGMWNNLDI